MKDLSAKKVRKSSQQHITSLSCLLLVVVLFASRTTIPFTQAKHIHSSAPPLVTLLEDDFESLQQGTKESSSASWRVFAAHNVSAGTIIETCPTIPIANSAPIMRSDINKYVFAGDDQVSLIALGWCMLYRQVIEDEHLTDSLLAATASVEAIMDDGENPPGESHIDIAWNTRLGLKSLPAAVSYGEEAHLPFATTPDLAVVLRQSIAQGEEVTVAIDCPSCSPDGPSLREKERNTLDRGKAKQGHCEIKRSTVDGAGKGVFVLQNYTSGEIIEVAPVILLPANRLGDSLLANYVFVSSRRNVAVLPLGNGAMMNHGSKPNVRMQWTQRLSTGPKYLTFKAISDIAKGEELFISYGIEWEKAWQEYEDQLERRTKSFANHSQALSAALSLIKPFRKSPDLPDDLHLPVKFLLEEKPDDGSLLAGKPKYLGSSALPHGGRGVFLTETTPQGTAIDICPIIRVPEFVRLSKLEEYVYAENGTMVLLGWCMMYNHSPNPDLVFEEVPEALLEFNTDLLSDALEVAWPSNFEFPFARHSSISYVTTRDISGSTEVFANYGDKWFASRARRDDLTASLKPKAMENRPSITAAHRVQSAPIYLQSSRIPGAGRGVFAGSPMASKTVVELCPILFLQDRHVKNSYLRNYVYKVPESRINALPLGYGAMYNHQSSGANNESANLRVALFHINTEAGVHKELDNANALPKERISITDLYLGFVTAKPVGKGEELTIDYGPAWEQQYKQWRNGLQDVVLLRPHALSQYPAFRHEVLLPTMFPWPDPHRSSIRKDVFLVIPEEPTAHDEL